MISHTNITKHGDLHDLLTCVKKPPKRKPFEYINKA